MVDPNQVAGTSWSYEFQLLSRFDRDASSGQPGLHGYFTKTRPLFNKIAENWSQELHSEWLLRQYLALKLVMASSIQIGSADHAYAQNLKMAVPYLSYYAMFNAMRANLLTSPRIQFGKKTLTISHDKARDAYQSELLLLASEEEDRKSVV